MMEHPISTPKVANVPICWEEQTSPMSRAAADDITVPNLPNEERSSSRSSLEQLAVYSNCLHPADRERRFAEKTEEQEQPTGKDEKRQSKKKLTEEFVDLIKTKSVYKKLEARRQGRLSLIREGKAPLSRKVLAERLVLEIQMIKKGPRFLILLLITCLLLAALQSAKGPHQANHVRELLVQKFDLDTVKSANSPASVLTYLRGFSKVAQEFHPLSGTYLADPLQVELIGEPFNFEDTHRLPAQKHPVLPTSFSFTTWLHIDASKLGVTRTRYTLVNKVIPAARYAMPLRTITSCWGWFYIARKSTSAQLHGWSQLEFGRHLDTYHVIPNDAENSSAAQVRPTGAGPMFLALVVDGSTRTVKMYEGGKGGAQLVLVEQLPIGTDISDCGGPGEAAELEVGDTDIQLAQMRFYPHALQLADVAEVASLGQPLAEIAACTGGQRSTHSSGTESDAIRRDLSTIIQELDVQKDKPGQYQAAANVDVYNIVMDEGQASSASNVPQWWPKDAMPVIAARLGNSSWNNPGDVSRPFGDAFAVRSEITMSQWLSSKSATGYHLAISPSSQSSFNEQCLAIYRREEGNKIILRILIGSLTPTAMRSTRYCRVEDTFFYSGSRNHYAMALRMDDADGSIEAELFLDGAHLCGLRVEFENPAYTTLKDCLLTGSRIGSAWVGKRAPDSGRLAGMSLDELVFFPRRLNDTEVARLARDTNLQTCVDGAIQDDPVYTTPLGHSCTQLRLLFNSGFPTPCDARSWVKCPIACRHRLLCHPGGSLPGRYLAGEWAWCHEGNTEEACMLQGTQNLRSYSGLVRGGLQTPTSLFESIISLGDGGAICMDRSLAAQNVPLFLEAGPTNSAACSVALPASAIATLVMDARDVNGRLVEQQHCEAERKGSQQFCQFDAGALSTVDSIGWRHFTMTFWARGRDFYNEDQLYFMSTARHACFQLANGVWLKTWGRDAMGNNGTSKIWLNTRDVYAENPDEVRDAWHFHAITWDAQAGLLTLMVNGRFVQTSTSFGVDCVPGLRMIVKHGGPKLALSSIRFLGSTLPLSRLQEQYYTDLPRYSANYIKGARRTRFERASLTDVSPSPYKQRTLAASTPIVYQTRHATEECKGEFANMLSESYSRVANLRCREPYKCAAQTAFFECASDEALEEEHLGRQPTYFKGEKVFAEFLLTLSSPFIVRQGKVASPDNFVDFKTKKLSVVHVFYTPDYEMASVLTVSFDLGKPAIQCDWRLQHLKVPRGLPLVATALALITIDCAMIWLAALQLRRTEASSRLVGAMLGPDMVLRLVLIIFIGLQAIKVANPEDSFKTVMGPITLIDWATTNVEDKVSNYFDSLDRILNEINTNKAWRDFEFFLLLIVFARLLYYLKMHPRVGILIRTFELCLDDMFHFVLLFSGVNLLLGFLAWCIFGSSVPEFSTIGRVLIANYVGFMEGETVPFTEHEDDPLLVVFILIFVLLVWGCLLNFFLAIIFEAYARAKTEVEKFEAEGNLIVDILDLIHYAIFARWYKWPRRTVLLREVRKDEDGLIMLEELQMPSFCFVSIESAEAWYHWQCTNHPFSMKTDAFDVQPVHSSPRDRDSVGDSGAIPTERKETKIQKSVISCAPYSTSSSCSPGILFSQQDSFRDEASIGSSLELDAHRPFHLTNFRAYRASLEQGGGIVPARKCSTASADAVDPPPTLLARPGACMQAAPLCGELARDDGALVTDVKQVEESHARSNVEVRDVEDFDVPEEENSTDQPNGRLNQHVDVRFGGRAISR